MTVLLNDAFSVVILNLALPGSNLIILLGIPLIVKFTGRTFCLWNFLEVLLIVILPCNTLIVVLSDSTLDMSVILSGSPFVFDTPFKYFCLQHSTAIRLIVVLPGSIRLDSPFNFDISWQFFLIVMLPCSRFICYYF